MASRKTKKNYNLQRSASTLTTSSYSSSSSMSSASKSTFSRIWGSFRRSQSTHSVADGYKVVDDCGKINVEIIKSINDLDESVLSFSHGKVETIPPGM